MAVDSRDSNANLSVEDIRARVSDIDIFKYYCEPFEKLGKKFSSELREDPVPSAVISDLKSGIRYTDFGYREHSFDSIGYVMYKYSLTFRDTLTMIDSDFNIGLSSGMNLAAVVAPVISRKTYKIGCGIQIRTIPWSLLDREYWCQYGLSIEQVKSFHVKPISHYWINGNRYSAPKCTYAYAEHTPRFKIYSPLNPERKWYGNVKSSDIQGKTSLLPFGDRCIIASSLKDVMVIHSFGVHAIAFQSEAMVPPEKFMKILKSRYDKVEVLYDNDITNPDNPGQTMANKICSKYDLTNIVIPAELNCKDISDVVEAHGPITAISIVKRVPWQQEEKVDEKV
jgi:hypothetical protein